MRGFVSWMFAHRVYVGVYGSFVYLFNLSVSWGLSRWSHVAVADSPGTVTVGCVCSFVMLSIRYWDARRKGRLPAEGTGPTAGQG